MNSRQARSALAIINLATLSAALTFILSAAPASADPVDPCANGRACASAPDCPTRAVAVPQGPHADGSTPKVPARECITVSIAPKTNTTQAFFRQ